MLFQVFRSEIVLPDGTRDMTVDVYVSEEVLRQLGNGDRIRAITDLIRMQPPRPKASFEDLDLPQDPDVVN